MKFDQNPTVRGLANEVLALIGYVEPPRGRGIRMISIDGGGTRYVDFYII